MLGKVCYDVLPGDEIVASGPARFRIDKKTGRRSRIVVDADPDTKVVKIEAVQPPPLSGFPKPQV